MQDNREGRPKEGVRVPCGTARRLTALIAAGALAASMSPAAALALDESEVVAGGGSLIAEASDDAAANAPEAGDAAESGASAVAGEAADDAAAEADGADGEAQAGEATQANETPAAAARAAQAGDEAGDGQSQEAVAKIGETTYDTLDGAVAAAEDGATIEVLKDCKTQGLNLSKDITIKGVEDKKPTVTFTKHGIALWGKALTFTNCDVVMNGIGSTPYTGEWNWMTICASKNASLSLDNATMTMDGAGTSNKHAVYFCSNNKLNLSNKSVLTIKNYQQDALEWDGGDGGYNVNITDSMFVSDHNRSGFTGTFYATIDNSKVDVINSTGNGSNGSHFIIKNSDIDFSNNGSHGLSTGILNVSDSTITADNNGMTGIIFNNKATFANSTVSISGTKGTSYWNAGMRALGANASCSIGENTDITIADNSVAGIFLDAGTSLTVEEGAEVLVTRNHAEQANCSTKKDLAQMGGGIVVRDNASAMLSSTTKIYNNHAALAGDDICLEGDGSQITFHEIGSDWKLDGAPDCNDEIHAIDGWYNDSKDGRWNAHADLEAGEENNIALVNAGTLTGPTALKAAHGLYTVNYSWVGEESPSSVTPPSSDSVQSGQTYDAKDQELVDGWTFDGWYTDPDCTEKYVDGTSIDRNMTLYGFWTKVEVPEVPGGDEPEEPAVPSDPAAPTDQATPSDQASAPADKAEAPRKATASKVAAMPKTADGLGAAPAVAGASALGAAALALVARLRARRENN